MTDITPAVRADLAPTGTLRAGVNYGNFILATKDRATGESRGVAVDLMQELGRRLGVPVEIVAYDSVAVMGDAAPTCSWDIAFLGSDPAREALMSFTAAYLEIDATYLVPGASPLRTAAEVDREGVRVAAPARANYELFLTRNLKRAQLVSAQGGDAAFDLLVTGKADALAGLTQGLLGLAGKLPGSRLVEGRFMGVQQSIAVPKGRDAGLAYLRQVVEDAKASGLVARAIEKTGARGVSVAPAANIQDGTKQGDTRMSDAPTFGRYAEMPVDRMTPEQREGYRFLVEGPRGRLPGPYKVWVHNPKLLRAAAPLGQHFTPDQSSLSEREREIAVLVITSRWQSAYPTAAHEKRGKEVGLPAAAVEAIIANLPTSFSDAREQAVYEVAMALAAARLVPQGLYDRAVAVLGHESVTDMIVLMGYYTSVSLTMNFYAVPAGSPGLAR